MSHFPISYFGNKRNEIKYFIDFIKLDKVENIYEPFCGSCAISFGIYKKYGDKYKYFLSDNSTNLIKLLEYLKNTDPEVITDGINNIINSITSKEDYKAFWTERRDDLNMLEYIYFNKYSYKGNIGSYDVCNNRGLKSTTIFKFSKEQLLFLEFLKQDYVYINCNSWEKTFEDKVENLYIFDPPYMLSYNDLYQDTKDYENIYKYFADNNIKNFTCKIFFVLENLWINKLIFKDCNSITYNKMYAIFQKKTKHIFIENWT